MDPFITGAAVGGAVGGAAGKLIEKAWEAGEKWLAWFFKDHYPEAQQSAKENALDFLNELANRVRNLEEAVDAIPEAKSRIEDALSDPDFSVLLKDALIASSRTASGEKHKLLARLVSERLLAEQESMIALAGNLACAAIPHLSPKHLRFLGIMATVYHIRPDPFPPTVPSEAFQDWWLAWLEGRLSPLIPLEKMTSIDYAHLLSVSCITYEYVVSRDLRRTLSPPSDSGLIWDVDKFLTQTPIGMELSELWKGGMEHAVPTSAGILIGVYVCDLLTETKTIIKWD